jgi:hypothetical protein
MNAQERDGLISLRVELGRRVRACTACQGSARLPSGRSCPCCIGARRALAETEPLLLPEAERQSA